MCKKITKSIYPLQIYDRKMFYSLKKDSISINIEAKLAKYLTTFVFYREDRINRFKTVAIAAIRIGKQNTQLDLKTRQDVFPWSVCSLMTMTTMMRTVLLAGAPQWQLPREQNYKEKLKLLIPVHVSILTGNVIPSLLLYSTGQFD